MIRDFGSFTRRGLLADLDRPAEIWWGTNRRQSGGSETGEEKVEDGKTTDLPAVRESERPKDSASSWETPMILNALVSTP